MILSLSLSLSCTHISCFGIQFLDLSNVAIVIELQLYAYVLELLCRLFLRENRKRDQFCGFAKILKSVICTYTAAR